MKWYPWLRPDFEQLVASYQSGRGHHALLIHALAGLGDDALIYAINRLLLCQTPQGNKSCGRCRGCELMQAGTHPDYYVLAPEKGKSTLGIDAVREVNEKLYEHARLGGAKVVCLPDAAQLSDAAANALLKTLEEPPAQTWFFLACREPVRLLPTLRSRCRMHHLAPPAEQYAATWLLREVTTSQEATLTALRLSAGSPGAAQVLLQDDKWKQRQALCEAANTALAGGDWLAMLPALNHDNAPDRLQWLASLILDALKLQQGATLVTNVDAPALVQGCARQWRSDTLHALLHAPFTCREQLLSVVGVNRELLLTDLLLHLKRYLHSGATLPVSHL